MKTPGKTPTKAAMELYSLFVEAVDNGKEGDYALCSAIVEAFREARGDESAAKCRRVLWGMIQEGK